MTVGRVLPSQVDLVRHHSGGGGTSQADWKKTDLTPAGCSTSHSHACLARFTKIYLGLPDFTRRGVPIGHINLPIPTK
jgi:hypothetical protein